VMIIMALDHSREYFHSLAMTSNPLDPDTTTGALYFTRWITHFCAPIFVFLSGLSAFLSSQKKTKNEASKFLIKRGIWLLFVEIVIVNFGLTFNPLFNFIILQVIWALAWSMILLAIFSRISTKLVLIIGLAIIAGHNILNHIDLPQSGTGAYAIKILFTAFGTIVPVGEGYLIGFFYAILPWTGIFFVGYAVGKWYAKGFNARVRKKNLLISGTFLTLLFIGLRSLNVYGDPFPRKEFGDLFKNFLSFMDASKYPPSLIFTGMTIGPAMLLLAISENFKGIVNRIISLYGSVPFFYYILHFYLLHSILVIVFFATGNGPDKIIGPTPFLFRPVDFGFGLIVVYGVWIFVVAILYKPCKWFKEYKDTHTQWWLKYI
ncbi:MAG: DUF1624 domain-containing protein, partial [Pedobacter sp.]